ncbi:MAG: glycosyltransferase [Nitrospira sp.]|nr:glycosyltransferase [Nitrospira sp.]
MTTLRLCFIGPANNVTFRRWVEWFTARGHETTVLTVEPTQDTHHFRQIDLSCNFVGRKVGRIVSALRVAHVVRGLRPDVVHAHYLKGLAWGVSMVRFCPLVVTPWGNDVLEEQGAFKEWYSCFLTKKLLVSANIVALHSNYMESRIRGLLPNRMRVVRVGWGINLQAFKSGLDVETLRQRWNIDWDQPIIFSPRLAQPFYRHDLVIRALSLIQRESPRAVLVISEQFPDFEYLCDLRKLVSDLKLDDHVRFIGSIPYSDMPLWMNLAHIMIMVPQSDGMPNTLWEAMACGALPVLNRLPQYAEIIEDGINGLLVEPEPTDMARVMAHALATPGLKANAGFRNRELVKTMADQDQEMARMESWYERLRETWPEHVPIGG